MEDEVAADTDEQPDPADQRAQHAVGKRVDSDGHGDPFLFSIRSLW
jgi:hypothetical protein